MVGITKGTFVGVTFLFVSFQNKFYKKNFTNIGFINTFILLFIIILYNTIEIDYGIHTRIGYSFICFIVFSWFWLNES